MTTVMGEGTSIERKDLDGYMFQPPLGSDTHRPIAWAGIIDIVQHRASRAGWEIDDISLKVGGKKRGTDVYGELYGTIALKGGDGHLAPQIALRTSYNKNYATQLCAGARVLVCSNGMFIGDYAMARQKATGRDGWDPADLLDQQCQITFGLLSEVFELSQRKRDDLAKYTLGSDDWEAYALLGNASGQGVLPSTVYQEALRQWKKPEHNEFKPRDAWSLYNACTHGAKKVSAGATIDVLTDIDKFFSRHVIEDVKAKDARDFKFAMMNDTVPF